MAQDRISTAAQPAQQESGASDVAQSPFCRELRSKRYYFLQQMPTVESDLLDGSNRCWCRLTMQVVGPDSQMVRPKDCTAGRSCYRSRFEE